jgi:hypothetical protein
MSKELPPNDFREKLSNSDVGGFQVEAVPLEFAGVLLSKGNISLAKALKYLPILSFIGSVGLVGWIIFGRTNEDATGAKSGLYHLLGVGVVIMAASYFFMSKSSSLLNRWLLGIARTKIKNRPDRRVDPNDPKARFVAVVPRSSWPEPTFFNAADVGFLIVDHSSNMLLFEGDIERYRIPVQSIAECKQEYVSMQTSTPLEGNVVRMYKERRYFFTVIQILSSKQSCELAFRILTGKGLFNQEAQGAANLSLLAEIHQLKRFV